MKLPISDLLPGYLPYVAKSMLTENEVRLLLSFMPKQLKDIYEALALVVDNLDGCDYLADEHKAALRELGGELDRVRIYGMSHDGIDYFSGGEK